MAIYNDLLSQAAQIRDEANERKNTALRVGTMFVDLIQKLQAKLPATIVDASTIGSVTYNPTTITIKFGTTDDDGTDGEVTLTIKEASLLSAGLMASADKIELRSILTKRLPTGTMQMYLCRRLSPQRLQTAKRQMTRSTNGLRVSKIARFCRF